MPVALTVNIDQATERALVGGFRVLRVIADMTWSLREPWVVERLGEYECRVNALFAGGKLATVCQYDRREFADEIVTELAGSHPSRSGPRRPRAPWPASRSARTG